MPHDFCRRFEIVFYVNAVELKMNCYILNFKHYYKNSFIVITLLTSKVICREKAQSLRQARNIFRESTRGEREVFQIDMTVNS